MHTLNFYRLHNLDSNENVKKERATYVIETGDKKEAQLRVATAFAVFLSKCYYQKEVPCLLYRDGKYIGSDICFQSNVSVNTLYSDVSQWINSTPLQEIVKYTPLLIFEENVEEELIIRHGMVFAVSVLERETRLNLYTSQTLETFGYSERFLEYIVKIYQDLLEARNYSDICLINNNYLAEIAEINRTEVPFDENLTLDRLFGKYVNIQPDAPAITDGVTALTYRELDNAASSIAAKILRYSEGKNGMAAILGRRGISYIVAVLAVLKAGLSYVPLDREFPSQRIVSILEESKPVVLLTTEKVEDTYGLDNISANEYDIHYMQQILSSNCRAGHPAYVIFTSGTTGKPKGVILSHKGAVNLAAYLKRTFEIQKGKAVLQFANMVFDASVWELLASIFSGGELVIPSDENIRDIYKMQSFLRDNPVELAVLPPQYYAQLNTDSIGQVVTAGSASSVEVAEKAIEHSKCYINAYGPTEITVHATSWKPECYGNVDRIFIGKPIDNTEIHIYNGEEECPIGVIGELCICGAGVALGYMNREELTKEKFTDSPYGKMYHSGDLGYFSEDGNIVFLGRKDKQIKIRGFRIEKEEIESVLIGLGLVKEAAVVLYKTGQEEKLIAFVTSDKIIYPEVIKEKIGQALTNYMIPDNIIQVEEIPVTFSGKTDENALLENYEAQKHSQKAVVTFRDETEEEVYKIMCKVLSVTELDITKGFLENGGNSLSAIILQNELFHKFSVMLSLVEIFKLKTVINIAERLRKTGVTHNTVLPQLIPDKENIGEPFPMTDLQKAYYIGAMDGMVLSDKSTRAYSRILCRNYDAPRFKEAVYNIIKNHDVLRTRIYEDGMQRVIPIDEISLPEIPVSDISDMTQAEQVLWLEKYKKNIMDNTVFYPDRPQMMYIEVTSINSSDVYIHFLHDGIVADGWSHELLITELEQYYISGKVKISREMSFRDYACYFHSLKETEVYKESRDYWINEIKTFSEAPQLPLNEELMEGEEFTLENVRRVIPEKTLKSIAEYSKAMNLSEFVVMFTAFCKAIAKYSFSQNFLLNVPEVMRPQVHKDMNNLIGECSNFFLFDFHNNISETVLATAHRIQDKLAEIKDHNLFSGIDIITEYRKYNSDFTGIVTPIVFTELLSCEKQKREHFIKECTVSHTSQVWMDAVILREHDDTVICLDCVKGLFGEDITNGIADTFIGYLKNLDKWGRMFCLPAFERDKHAALLCNDTPEMKVERRLYELLEDSFNKYGEKIAITDGEHSYTYDDVKNKAERVAFALCENQIKEVALWMHKSPLQIIFSIGCVLAGVSYMPIDMEYTDTALQNVMAQTGIKVIATEQESIQKLSTLLSEVEVVSVEDFFKREVRELSVEGRSDFTYIINTSGTTGIPKSIQIGEEGLVSCLLYTNSHYHITSQDSVLAVTSYCHDMAVYDIFGILLAGGKIVVPTVEKDVDEWYTLMEEQKVTIWNSVPAIMKMMEALACDKKAPFASLRLAFLGGDRIPTSLIENIWKYNPGIHFVSVGGPSETTLWNISHTITKEDIQNEIIPYGTPFPNTEYYILNENMELCPIGITGEMYISGIGVAQGYYGMEELTKEKFLYWKGRRVYRTGDLGIYLEDGTILIAGRSDNQIKRNGKRIEIEGIERIAEATEGINQCAVVYLPEKDELCAFYTADGEIAVTEKQIRAELGRNLQWYMIPNRFIRCDKFPVTVNGKVNRKLLKTQAEDSYEENRIAAQNGEEQDDEILNIVREILNNQSIQNSDHFYNVGGTSMLAIRILSQVRKKLNLKINLGKMLSSPVIGSWKMMLDSYSESVTENAMSVVPLSFTQEEIFIADQINQNGKYTMCAYAKIDERPDLEKLEKALKTVLRHHAVMSSYVVVENGEPMMHFSEELCVHSIDYLSFDTFSSALEYMHEVTEKRMDISKKGLYRIQVLEVLGQGWYILLMMHHIIADEQTYALILKDIDNVYHQREGLTESLPFVHYLKWAAVEEPDMQLEEKLLDQKPLQLPYEAKTEEKGVQMLTFQLPSDDINQLRDICSRYNTSLFTGMFGIFAAALSKITDKEHICISVPFSDRMQDDYENTAGLFITKVLLMMDISKNMSLAELLQNAAKAVDEGMKQTSGALYRKLREEGKDRNIRQIHNHIVFNFVETAFADTLSLVKTETDSTTGLHLFVERITHGYECSCVFRKNMLNESQAMEICDKWMQTLKWYVRYDRYLNSEKEEKFRFVDELIEKCSAIDKKAEEEPEERQYPLSMIQNQMLFSELSSNVNRSVLAGYVVLRGNIDSRRMVAAVRKALERHDALRFTYDVSGDEPVQMIKDIPENDSEFYSYYELQDETKIKELLDEFSHKQMNLTKDVLYRFMLIKRSEKESYFAESFHHIISDEQTFMIILHDILSFYELGEKYAPVKSDSYGQYITAKTQSRSASEWWRKRLTVENLEGIVFPNVIYKSGKNASEIDTLSIDTDCVNAFLAQCRKQKITDFMGLLSVFMTTLYVMLGKDRISVVIPYSERADGNYLTTCGLFIDKLLVTQHFSPDMTAQSVLNEVRDTMLSTYAQNPERMRFTLKEVNLERNFEQMENNVVFNVINSVRERYRGNEIEAEELLYLRNQQNSGIHLHFCIELIDGEYQVAFSYNTKFVGKNNIDELKETFVKVLSFFEEHREKALSELMLKDIDNEDSGLINKDGEFDEFF